MVAKEPVQEAPRAHGDARLTGVVIALHRAGRTRPLEVIPDVDRGRRRPARDGAFHSLAVAIILKADAQARPAYARQMVSCLPK